MRIALVEWNWSGHHPTYFNNFILALEDLGIDVLALCPSPAEAAATARAFRPPLGTVNSPRGHTHFVKIKVPVPRWGRLRPARLSGIDLAIRRFAGLERQVREESAGSGDPVAAIFYACIYDWDFQGLNWARPWLRLPWLGLYLPASQPRPGWAHRCLRLLPDPVKIFRHHLCRGFGILDEQLVGRLARSTGKPVFVVPDLTDERPATSSADRVLGAQLKRFAAGRPIVGLLGHLKKSKGLLTFLEAAQLPGAANVCFALAGEVIWDSVAPQADQIKRLLANSPNIWSHLARIPNEPCFNDLLAAGDVVFAAYWDFPHSSGMVTKAAVFHKPLIVSDGHLMAERVRRYHLGEVIPQRDARALLEALLNITRDPAAWVAAAQPQWPDFCRVHSFEQLKVSLHQLLAGL